MKKILLSLVLVVFGSAGAFAQFSIGVKGGFNFANVGGDAEDTDMRTSIHLGGYLNYKLSDQLSFQPELLYSSVGYKMSESNTEVIFGDEYTEKGKLTAKYNYLSIPLMLQYKIGPVNLQAGPQVSLFMGGKYKGEYTLTVNGAVEESESGEEDVDDVKGLDLGLNFGLGTEFGKLNASLRYSMGLSNTYDGEGSDDYKETNNVIQLSIGYRIFGDE
jgi:hypothetical protein